MQKKDFQNTRVHARMSDKEYLRKYRKRFVVKREGLGSKDDDAGDYIILCKNGIVDLWDSKKKILRYSNNFDYRDSKNSVTTPVTKQRFTWLVKKLKDKPYFNKLDISEYLQEIKFPEAYLEDISRIIKTRNKRQYTEQQLFMMKQRAIKNFKLRERKITA